MEVRAYYDVFNEDFDKMLYQAAGRVSDFSGCGTEGRDHGWVCETEFEAFSLERKLRNLCKVCPSLVVNKVKKGGE